MDYEAELVAAIEAKGFKASEIDELIDSERLVLVSRGYWQLDGEDLLVLNIVGNC